MPEDRDLDRSIDEALGTYADSFTDANLTGRVLVRLASERATRPRLRWLPWAVIAFPAAVCLLLFVYFGPGITKAHVAPQVENARLHNPAGNSARLQPRAASTAEITRQFRRAAPRPHRLATATAAQPLPKLDVFPTPTPLTPQERALAVYVARAPQAERQALAQSEQELNPLTVASMRVMPLETPDETANTN